MSSQINRFSLISIVAVINIIAIGLTLSLTQWFVNGQIEVIGISDVRLYLICLIFVGIICMCLVLAGQIKLERRGDAREGPYHYILYIGLYIFGIGAILLDLLESAMSIHCASNVHSFLQSHDIPSNYTTDLQDVQFDNNVYSIMYITKSIYVIIQLSMLTRFRGYKTETYASKFAIMATLATNAALYIFTFLQETQERLDEESPTDDQLKHYVDNSSAAGAANVSNCLKQNTSIQVTVSEAEKYMYPFDMEFCLVAAGMLLSMFVANDNIEVRRDEAGAEENTQDAHDRYNNAEVEDDAEHTPLLTSSRAAADGRQTGRQFNPCKFAFNFAIALSIVLILMEALRYDPDLHNSLQIAFYVARIIYYILLLAVTIVGAWLVHTSTNVKMIKLHPETILLLVAATGEFIYLYFGLLASTAVFSADKLHQVEELEESKPTNLEHTLATISWLTFFTNLMDIVQIGTQTYILMEADGCRGERFRWRKKESKKRYWFEEVLWYLCVCNFFKWVTDSFVEGNFLSKSEAKNIVFGMKTWTGITQSTYPLVLFYRFHSVHMIIGSVGFV